MTLDSRVEDMLAKQDCQELVYRFARGLDRRDEATLRSVFHPEATDDHGYFKGTASDFIEWVLPLLARMERTQHLIGNVLVETRGDQAVSESYFLASHDVTAANGEPARMTAAGRYLDQFKKHEGEWKIIHRQAVYDWNANEPRTDSWDRSAATERDLGKASQDDSVFRMLEGFRIP